MFGSSYNGFGFSKSDLDLCVTFDKHPTGEVRTNKTVVAHYFVFLQSSDILSWKSSSNLFNMVVSEENVLVCTIISIVKYLNCVFSL